MGTTTFGREGENLAKVYLEKKGYKFLDRNFKRIHGEVDLIMMDGDVCFCRSEKQA
jgi:putative endonuclease